MCDRNEILERRRSVSLEVERDARRKADLSRAEARTSYRSSKGRDAEKMEKVAIRTGDWARPYDSILRAV